MHDRPFVQVLGAVRFVTGDGESLSVPSASQRRLLALLALGAGTTVRSEHLCELLGVSTGALRTTVSRLRRRLGEDVIVTDAVGYRIGCPVDAARFADMVLADHVADHVAEDRLEQLDAALALWHGDVLDEFRHEPWAEADATRLDELRCLAIEERLECLLRRGRCGEVVAEAESYLATHPLRDRPWGLLMEALAEDGRRSEALRCFQEYRTMLEQTGLEPSDAVRSIERRIAAGQLGSGADDLAALGPPPRPSPDPSGRLRVPLPGSLQLASRAVGRYHELATLSHRLGLARRGRLQAVVLSGEAGIGKTTVLAAFARAHDGRADTTVLYGRCEEGGDVPLQPLRTVVESIVEHAPTPLLRAHVECFGGELRRVAPRLASRLWVPPPLTADDRIERHQLFAAITDLIRRVTSHGPVALLLDDLHWAEPTSLLLLRHLADVLTDAPLLVVVSFRDVDGDVAEELHAALAQLDRAGAVRLHLRGLDDDGLAAVVTAAADVDVAPDDELLDSMRDQTAGNPLYAAHLARHLADIGAFAVVGDSLRLTASLDDTAVPDSLNEVVRTRVRSLGASAQSVLRAAAVLGVEFDQRVLLAMCDLTGDDLATALDEAVGAGLLVEGGRTACSMRFTHALVARSLSAGIGAPGRRRLHERAANALIATAERESSAWTEDELPITTVTALARHAREAGDVAAAQHWAATAGDQFLEHLAPAEASAWYAVALDHALHLGRPAAVAGLTERLGAARLRSGEPRADRTLLDAAALARSCGADDVLVRAALTLDHGVARLGGVDEAHLSTIEAALGVVGHVGDASHARLLALHARYLLHLGRADEARREAEAAVALLGSDGDAVLAQMIPALASTLRGPGTLPTRRDLTRRAVAAADELDDRLLQFWSRRSAYVVAVESADAPAAVAALDELRTIVDEVPEPRLRWLLGILDTFEATMSARLDEAERHARATLAVGLEIGEPDASAVCARQRFVIRSMAGRRRELVPTMERLVARRPGSLQYRLGLAVAQAAAGRLDEARKTLERGASLGFDEVAVDHMWLTTIIGYAVLAIELADRDVATELRALLAPFADEVSFNGITGQGPIGAYVGRLDSLLGDHEQAERHLEQALHTATAFGWVYHRAAAMVALAQVRARRTGLVDATGMRLLRDAGSLAERHGLEGLAEQVARIGVDTPARRSGTAGGSSPGRAGR